jgi:hypothetical protein
MLLQLGSALSEQSLLLCLEATLQRSALLLVADSAPVLAIGLALCSIADATLEKLNALPQQ